MKLKVYLAEIGVSGKAFARELGITPIYLYGICSGQWVPGKHLINRITEKTKGHVTEKDFSLKEAKQAEKEKPRKEKPRIKQMDIKDIIDTHKEFESFFNKNGHYE